MPLLVFRRSAIVGRSAVPASVGVPANGKRN